MYGSVWHIKLEICNERSIIIFLSDVCTGIFQTSFVKIHEQKCTYIWIQAAFIFDKTIFFLCYANEDINVSLDFCIYLNV